MRDSIEDAMLMGGDEVGFGGGNEPGLLCGCGRRVRTPFCPWCGKAIDDAPSQLIAYLEKNADQNERAADTKESKGEHYPGHKWQVTVERLRQKAVQQRGWAKWVRSAREKVGARKS